MVRSVPERAQVCAEALWSLSSMFLWTLSSSKRPAPLPCALRCCSRLQALQGKPLTVYGDGQQTRSFQVGACGPVR